MWQGSCTSDHGTGGGGANLESGLDNSPVTEGVPFNETGLYLQDEYDDIYWVFSSTDEIDCISPKPSSSASGYLGYCRLIGAGS